MLFVVNRVVDMIFLIDVILQFFIMYPVNEGREGARWVTDRKTIANNYLRGWFTLDVVSIGVSAFDYLALGTPFRCPGESNALGNLKVLRTLRALRLIKLTRLLRASRMLRRWEVRMAVNYSILALVKCATGVVLLSHWFACVRALIANMQDSILHSWEGDDLFCRNVTLVEEAHYADGSSRFGPTVWEQREANCEIQCDEPGVIYVAALHWSVMTLLGEASATAGNTTETLTATVLMLLGAMVWGQVVATFVSIVSTLHPEVAEFRNRMDELNSFLARQDLPHEMRQRLREYFHQTEHLRIAAKQRELIKMMSSALQHEVAWACNQMWLQRVYFLKDAPLDFLVHLALKLEALVFAPGEVLPCGRLYIVNRGLAIYAGRLLGTGKVWGEQDVIIDNESLRQNLCARALNFLEVFAIDRPHLEAVTDAFPEVARGIRRVAVRLAARRAFIRYAKEVLQERTGRKPNPLDAFSIESTSPAFVDDRIHVLPQSPGSPLGHAKASDVLKELSRQASRQHDLANAVAQLTQSVKQLRDDLIPEGQQASRKD